MKKLTTDLETRIIWNTAFNDPDEDSQLLMRCAIVLAAIIGIVHEEIKWQEVADRIFLDRHDDAAS
jgi:hypothetical protein